MKGESMLRINQATLVEALQEYLDKRLVPDAQRRVVEVCAAIDGYLQAGELIQSCFVKMREPIEAVSLDDTAGGAS